MALKVDPRDFPAPELDLSPEASSGKMVLAGGCFWCTEAVFELLEGVEAVLPGYAGGAAETANYKTVCTGQTGHAEAIEIRFDPERISFGEILRMFFSVAHDPTQVNRQGADVGTQYRSAIFYASEEERAVAEEYIRQIEEAGVFAEPVATTLEPLEVFYPAEAVHCNYARSNPDQPYIRGVSTPKVDKLKKAFAGSLKPEYAGR